MKLRKGDAPKAALLLVTIVAVLGFVVWQFRAATRTGPTPQPAAPAGAARSPGAAQGGAQSTPSEEMFAARPRSPMSDITRARAVSNPFRAPISLRPAPATARGRAAQPPPPPPLPEWPNLRLIGIMAGTRDPLAVLADGERRFYLRRGGSLPEGWLVAAINSHSVVLKKGSRRVALVLTPETNGG